MTTSDSPSIGAGPERSLLFHGGVQLLLSIAAGGLITLPIANPRMALSAHLAALMAAPILIAIGLAWPQLRLAARARHYTARALVVSLYLNTGMVLAAALLGTSDITPIAGAGHKGAPWQEAFVTGGFVVAVLGVTGAFGAVAYGFRPHPKSRHPAGH